MWTAQAGAPGTNLTDAEWRTATRYRLGIPLGPRTYHCQNRATDPDALRPTCGKRLGGYGCHALCCSYGPLRNTHHNEMADLVARMSQEAGATVTRETPIREFQTDRLAILDVTAFGIAEIVDLIVDVTVRHPTCAKYGRTDLETERAATMAEAEKQQRYPPAAGRRVTTLAVETWGRMGAVAEQVLQQLAAAARRRDQQRDRLAVNRIPKWRALIDATNQRSIARRILGAFLGSDGKPWRPPPYRRDAAHEANTHRLTAGEQMTFPHTGLDPARLHQWTDNVHGGGKGNDRRGTTTTQAPAGPPQTPLTPLRTRAETSPPRRAAPFPVSNHNATAAPSQSYQHDSCRTPSQTPHGSTYPQGLHAVKAHELEQPAGPATCNRTPYNTCLICLASPAGEGPNVCTREMTDFATHTQPATQCRAPTPPRTDQFVP